MTVWRIVWPSQAPPVRTLDAWAESEAEAEKFAAKLRATGARPEVYPMEVQP